MQPTVCISRMDARYVRKWAASIFDSVAMYSARISAYASLPCALRKRTKYLYLSRLLCCMICMLVLGRFSW